MKKLFLLLFTFTAISLAAEEMYTHDGKMNVFIMLNGGFGATRNPDLVAYNEQQSRRYLDYLQSNYVFWDDNEVGESGVSIVPVIGLELEGRVFLDSGPGVGITGGIMVMFIPGVNLLTPDSDSTVEVSPDGTVLYLSATLYYKRYIWFRNSLSFYLLGGAGPGLYHADYSLSISGGDSGTGAPGNSNFEKEFSGYGSAIHGILEAGVEENRYCFFAGLKARYGSIEELSSGSETMKLNSGKKVHMNLTGVVMYLGIGVFF